MEVDVAKLKVAISVLSTKLKNKTCEWKNFLSKNEITPADLEEILDLLAEVILEPTLTIVVATYFENFIPLIVLRLISQKRNAEDFWESPPRFYVALSKLVQRQRDVLRYIYDFLSDSPAPFDATSDFNPPSKKLMKLQQPDNCITELDVAKACLIFLENDVTFFRRIWNWSQFIDLYWNKGCAQQKLITNEVISILAHTNNSQKIKLNELIAVETVVEKSVSNDESIVDESSLSSPNYVTWDFDSNAVVIVDGVFLKIYNYENAQHFKTSQQTSVVKVASTRNNIRNLAMGISSGKAICLSGPVGCGKTILVEYLAKMTGRIVAKEKYDDLASNTTNGFYKIQLGDQTDSKMLLGQYRCTDVPGEFVWQPGVLTQAAISGAWILFEDLDSATQDVCTILTNLLENNYLSVPGFRDYIQIEPGFQIFFTLRTQTNHFAKANNSIFSILDKNLYTINIQQLLSAELAEIICSSYPKLTSIVTRIVDMFLIIGSGQNSKDDNSMVGLPNSGRHVSTRDLMKLCRRSNPNFSVTSTECAYFVFQNAVDLFCSHLPDCEKKTQLIVNVGAKLGIIESRCVALTTTYKPDVNVLKSAVKCGRLDIPLRAAENGNEVWDYKVPAKKRKVEGEKRKSKARFSFTRLSSCLLERIAAGVDQNEPILLVGETGVGKTSSVQFLSHETSRNLIVINMNQQSDVSDLLGGFKPVDLHFIVAPLRNEFEFLFRQTFNAQKNEKFLTNVSICFNRGEYLILIKLMLRIASRVFTDVQKNIVAKVKDKWNILQAKLSKLNSQLSNNSMNIAFSFIEGALVNCIKNGDWILLDEINLASQETLECLSTILEPDGSVCLLEKGDFIPVKRHPDFRIFACMNPNTDIGKKDLPIGIRNRFTELFVDELVDENDLMILVGDYLNNTGIQKTRVYNIVKLYKSLRALAVLNLNDGLGNRPVYSLRTLCRSLTICAKNLCGSIERNLYESFCLSFLTQLDPESHAIVLSAIQVALLSNPKAVLSQPIPKPSNADVIDFEGYWIETGHQEIDNCENYILTQSVRSNLRDLSRIISIGKLPILLQGPTSAGKTSLIQYIAKKSGNHCLRINNHEHTDLQEYVGTYTTGVDGKLTFQEGVLVQAMKKGFWIILDELNLAPSDILEALNRVLDDNRELFIPETQTLIKAHPNFMLFATQNPPGLYGGRKTLSRAFKNRFIELHFSEIPKAELEVILEKRCLIPKSYSQKMVKTMSELQLNRKSTVKPNFTLRDLFRWGNRYTYANKGLLDDNMYDWNQHLVDEGYLVLSSKVRNDNERAIIEEALFKNFRKKIVLDDLFTLSGATSKVTKSILELLAGTDQHQNIVWTFDMRQIAVLVAKALEFNEPVLLVGPTGCGKTTVCQILADLSRTSLRILNCHMHTEGADFLGGLRPYRGESSESQLFEWVNGPLVHAMTEGGYFLADEISLAEDSVLERLNSILEPERTLLLSEKGGVENSSDTFIIKASQEFQFLATMNPGGDFGKKELSPALRNRFTEIWCRPTTNRAELAKIAGQTVSKLSDKIPNILVETVYFLKNRIDKFNFSIRDILAWAHYIVSNDSSLALEESIVYGLETLFLDSLEMLPLETFSEIQLIKRDCLAFVEKLFKQFVNNEFTLENLRSKRGLLIEATDTRFGISPFFVPINCDGRDKNIDFIFSAPTTQTNLFRLLSALSLNKSILLEGPPGVGKTSIVENLAKSIGFNLVRINLCEHTDLADLFGADLPVDEIDYGNDSKLGAFQWRDGPLLAALKSENTWILLDELNLAPQSVLEGLNAILDHRGEVFIPELNRTFKLGMQTRIFAAQNPLRQGGGRKGLPQSFLNRFTKVYLRKLMQNDLLHVINWKFGDFFKELENAYGADVKIAERLVTFSESLEKGIADLEFGLQGGPYEVNLRDILRWCDFISHPQTGWIISAASKRTFDDLLQVIYEKMKVVYYYRMRSENDRTFIRNCFAKVFEANVDALDFKSTDISVYWTDDKIYLNDIVLEKTDKIFLTDCNSSTSLLLSSQISTLKNITECVALKMPIILSGPSDSGKTKSVDLFSKLADVQYDVDTIDDSVTGSFQQVDFNRQLEEISHVLEMRVFEILQDKLMGGKRGDEFDFAIRLYGQWEKFSKLNTAQVTSDELKLFKKRLRHLHDILKKIEAMNGGSLMEVDSRITKLERSVNKADTLNTGGHFEWIDSKIVKALKNGEYLCLEHANLCSSAVLDRLNSVLEPNGKLLISEKGVTNNSDSEAVEKHKNFRIFLTLDTKNGEISRAMRNRCVELHLGRDHYSEDDLKKLIYNIGVTDLYLINAIIQIHSRAKSISEFSQFTISTILKFAFLVHQNLKSGDYRSALKSSAYEVYVASSNVDLLGFGLSVFKSKLVDEIDDEIRNVVKYQDCVNFKNVVVKATEISRLKLIEMQAEAFVVLMKCQQNADINVAQNVSNLSSKFHQIINDVCQLDAKFLLWQLYEMSSNDIELRRAYLNRNIENATLHDLNETLYKTVMNFGIKLNALPWNNKIFPRLRDYISNGEANVGDQLKLSVTLFAKIIIAPIIVESSTKYQQMSALTYSKLITENHIPDNCNQPILRHIYKFLTNFEKLLGHHLLKLDTLDSEKYVNLMCAFVWNNRLQRISQNLLFIGKKLNDNLIDAIVLHFKWLEKYCMGSFRDYTPQFSQLYEHIHPLDSIRKMYLKQFVTSLPYYEEQQIKFHTICTQFQAIGSIFTKYGDTYRSDALKKLAIVLSDKYAVARNLLLETAENMTTENINLLENSLAQLIESGSGKVNCREFDVLPFLEYLALKCLKYQGNNYTTIINNKFYLDVPSISHDIRMALKTNDNSHLTEMAQRFELKSVLLRSNVIYNTDSTVTGELSVDGAILTDLVLAMLLSKAGELRVVGLLDMEQWKSNLRKMRCLAWNNMGTFDTDFNWTFSNHKIADEKFNKLLSQIEVLRTSDMWQRFEDNPTDFTQYFIKIISMLKIEHTKLNETGTDSHHAASMLFVIMGAIQINLATHFPIVDPVEKNRLKKMYNEEDQRLIDDTLLSYNIMAIMMNYEGLGEEVKTLLNAKKRELELKSMELLERVALRPEVCQYRDLRKDITHFMQTCCQPKVLHTLLIKIANCIDSEQNIENVEEYFRELNDTMKNIELLFNNIERFESHSLVKYSTYYQDFVTPIENSLTTMKYGLNGLKHSLIQIRDSIQIRPDGTCYSIYNNTILASVTETMMEFPTNKRVAQLFSSENTQLVPNILTVLDKIESKEQHFSKLLDASMLEIVNKSILAINIDDATFAELDTILNLYNKSWMKQEELKKKRQIEEDSLIVTKTKCATEDEEEARMREINSIFPNYVEKDFGDYLMNDSLEQKPKGNAPGKNTEEDAMGPENHKFLCDNFMYLMTGFSRCSHFTPDSNAKKRALNYVQQYTTRLEVFKQLFEKFRTSYSNRIDDKFYFGFCFLVGISQQRYNDLALTSTSDSAYNYYKDSNIAETQSCLDVLNRIAKRVNRELEDWPDHAVLIDIIKIVDKIYALPSIAPVVRFNTGFQILRQKIDEWNRVAHKNNNLKDLEIEVAEFVQKFTRIELQFWRECLSQTLETIQLKTYKYWFFIYNLIQEYIMGSSSSSINYEDFELNAEETNDAKEKLKSKEIISIVKNFIEKSSYGDFSLRMKILKSFELYLTFMAKVKSSAKVQTLIAIFHNLHAFFEQFAATIEESVKQMRQPIEKKLKEFVKIESYNKDLSYFSMKNNVAHVHRNLHKFLKDFEKQLSTSIASVFLYKSKLEEDLTLDNDDKGKNLRYEAKVKYYMIEVKNFMASSKLKDKYMLPPSLDFKTATLLPKCDKLFTTSRTIVKEAILHAQFPTLIYSLDTLLTEQIQTCDHLRRLEVDRSNEDRKKQVAQAKSILNQKKKALADLFKTLATIGINYKTGLMEKTLNTEVTDIKIAPFCLKTMLHKKLDQNVFGLSENIDLYYFKSVFKMKLLFNVFSTPNPAIGAQDIERMKGFSIDLFLLVQNQRKLLGQSVKELSYFKSQIKEITELEGCLGDDNLDFVNLGLRKERIHDGILSIRSLFEQINLLLKTIPDDNLAVENISPLNSLNFSSKSDLSKNIVNISQKILSNSIDMLNVFDKMATVAFFSRSSIEHLEEQYNKLVVDIKFFCGQFVNDRGEHLSILGSILELVEMLEAPIKIINGENIDFDDIHHEFDNIIHSVLMSMQNIYKKYSVAKEEFYKSQNNEELENNVITNDGDGDDEESDIENILESHLKLKIYQEIQNDIKSLNIEKVNGKLLNLLLCVKKSNGSCTDKNSFIQKLLGLVPILEQFYHLGQYYLIQQLGAHKVSSKMLSILLSVFIELGSKGFCVPPDLMQEEEQKQKDEGKGDGFGLEDGTGENDVSDRIENEDQLDDAKKPDEKKGDEQDDADCKEEKGIEMSDDFDAKMQDLDKKEDDDSDSDKSDDEEELDKQMGDTEENAETLDEQIWGDDEKEEEEEQDESKEMNDEDQGKGSDEKGDTHNDLDSQKEETDKNGKEDTGLDAAQEESKKQNRDKEIDEMPEDPEMDEEQMNPHHNELEEPPEAEDFNLDDNINMDNEEPNDKNDEEGDGDNPFDIDQMKDLIEPPEDGDDEAKDDGKDEDNKDEENDDSDDAENPEFGNEDKENDNIPDEKDESELQEPGEVDEEKNNEKDDEKENEEQSKQPEDFQESKNNPTKEENIQAMPETEKSASVDQAEVQTDDNQKTDEPMDEQDTGEDKDGVGKADNEESKTGHQGITDRNEQKTKDDKEKQKNKMEKTKQGNANEDRTLSDSKEQQNKRLKTIDKKDESEQNGENNEPEDDAGDENDDAEEYQHVLDPKKTDKTTLDTASEEQSKELQHKNDAEKENAEVENPEELMEVDDNEEEVVEETQDEIDSMKTDETTKQPSKKNKSDKTKETCDIKEEVTVEGETALTFIVPRSSDTTSHTISDVLMDMSMPMEPSTSDNLEMRKLYEKEILSNKLVHPDHIDFDSWQQISSKMLPNARELCEQLRLILEPTKCTRLKGDYRTGRRINMRKIIPYIASQFRKDKIWLRRTKPAQRDYKITIAIDDSKSMDHNQSKTLTLEAISLVSQALTLLESGKLNIVSFGESPQIILNCHEQFDGPKLVKSLNFEQNQSRIAELLDFTRISNAEDSNRGGGNLFENLLLVISDGRNIFSEGEQKVKNSVKLARLQRIFIVYIIIDNPENKHSILDIRVPIFSKNSNEMQIKSYLDTFPFPYYIIVRELGQLPLILSDAMRQWFELVNSEQ